MSEQTSEQPGSDVDVAVEAEPTGPARVSWAPVPRVNLLPIEVLEGRRFRRTQVGLGVAVVAVVVAAGAGTVWAQRGVSQAQDELDTARSGVSARQAEANRYAEVPKVLAEVDAANKARLQAMGADVLWYRYLDDIDGARPSGVKLTTMTVGLATVDAGAGAAGGIGKDVLTPAGIGTVQINGVARNYGQIATWMDQLDKISGFSAPSLGSATEGDDGTAFETGVVLDYKALSGRFNQKAK